MTINIHRMLLNVPGMSWLSLEHSMDKCSYLGVDSHIDLQVESSLSTLPIDVRNIHFRRNDVSRGGGEETGRGGGGGGEGEEVPIASGTVGAPQS